VEVTTTQPGLQFYTGNTLDGAVIGRGGVAYRQSAGFAFEAQNFPDAVNHERFPSPVLRPGEVYRHLIAYRFGAV
jgi:aldose 1-epimerase